MRDARPIRGDWRRHLRQRRVDTSRHQRASSSARTRPGASAGRLHDARSVRLARRRHVCEWWLGATRFGTGTSAGACTSSADWVHDTGSVHVDRRWIVCQRRLGTSSQLVHDAESLRESRRWPLRQRRLGALVASH
jgi:hypothetical protein